MRASTRGFLPILLFVALFETCLAGPKVVPHPKAGTVQIRNSKFVVVVELKDPKKIKLLQDLFRRSTRVGSTKTHLKTPTHKIDFSDRWLIDLQSGEFGILTKTVSDVYQIDMKEIATLKKLVKPAEQVVPPKSDRAGG